MNTLIMVLLGVLKVDHWSYIRNQRMVEPLISAPKHIQGLGMVLSQIYCLIS